MVNGSTPLDGAGLQPGAGSQRRVDAIFADLDGVVYRGAQPIEHAVESLNRAAEKMPVGYITNNASRRDDVVAEQLRALGLRAMASDVVTSPQAAMRLLADLVAPGDRVLVVGGDGLASEARKAGYRVTYSAADEPAAVVQGFTPEIGWKQLAEAAFALAESATGETIPWIATNTDWTLPLERGIAPGNGTLVSAVHTAVGRLPVVAGKPETPIFEEARARLSVENPLVLGDRLDTDILGARRAGMSSALVLTGVDRAKQLLAAGADSRPDFILSDLRGLFEPYPAVREKRYEVSVGSARVRLRGRTVEIRAAGERTIDLLRAACALIWNSEHPIHSLIVPPALYQ